MTKCKHERFTFHPSTSYGGAYFECYDCGEYAYEWTNEVDDEDGFMIRVREPIWPHEDETCVHGMSLWLCADPINHYPRDGAY